MKSFCRKEASVNKFYSESNFFTKINQSILVTYRYNAFEQSQDNMHASSSDVKCLNLGVLYALRSGVGVNIESSNMFVFIQTPIMNFSGHQKLLKIFDKPWITVPELKNTHYQNYFCVIKVYL